jgi:hypothetical protein
MAAFSVHHTTIYRYHRLMFRPRDSFDQRLSECHLEVSPQPAEIKWIHDAFGNCITLIDFNCHSDKLRFDTIIRIDHTPENTPEFRIEDYASTHPFSYDESELPDLRPYILRQHLDDSKVEHWLSTFVVRGARRPTGQLLMTLNQAISEGFSYKRRSADGTQSPDETIRRQEGACRDFALLMKPRDQWASPPDLSPDMFTSPNATDSSGLAVARRMPGARSTSPAQDWSSLTRPMASSVTGTLSAWRSSGRRNRPFRSPAPIGAMTPTKSAWTFPWT